jgi:hypothetical protein
MDVPAAKWSTLIIRVWRTGEFDLRGRLTELDDLEGPERPVAVVGSADNVLDATRAWLTRVLAASEN